MKFRVKETRRVTGWTYIEAESREEAEKLIDDGQSDGFEKIDWEWHETRWQTFEEVKPK